MRKLAICLYSFSAAIFAANYLLPAAWLLWLAAGFALACILILLLRQDWMLGFALICFGISAGCLCFSVHAMITMTPSARLDGKTLEIEGRVLAYPQVYDNYTRVEIRLSGEDLPHVGMFLYDNENVLAEAVPGDTVRCTVRVKRGDQRYGEYDTGFLSRDIYLTGRAVTSPERTPGGFDLRSLPAKLNHALSAKGDELFPSDTAAFMKSLMLGDKSDLYQDDALLVAMTRAGLMHIVAVSGMHIAFLIGLLQMLFGKGAKSSLLCLVMIWAFVLITGSSPSALRAAVMQSFLLLAPLVRRENDPATSLSVALALILAVNPYAACSVSLQLSFSAMAGILCLAEPFREALNELFSERWQKRLHFVTSTAASSLAVLAFSAPLLLLHFRSVSLLSPLTNILCLWAVSFCFCGGFFSCLLGFVLLPLGKAAAWLCSWIARYLFLIAKGVSSISFSTLYVRDRFSVIWIVLVYALFALAWFSRLKPWKRIVFPFALSALSLVLLLFAIQGRYSRGVGTISVIDVGQGQCIAVMAGDKTLVIDCGGINGARNAGEEAGAYLRSRGRKQVDLLLVTHLHADHCNGVSRLMEMMPVKEILIPADLEDEDNLLDEIETAAERHGIEIEYLREDSLRFLGPIGLQLFAPSGNGDANERCMCMLVSLGSYDMLITGDSSKTVERELLDRYQLHDIELLIVGHHGSRYASSGELLGSIGADTAIISVGYNNYGHPTYETLERLDAYGYGIYRTDLNGTVEVQVGDSYGEEN